MKKTNRLSRLLAMLLALAMLVNSQGMTSMAAVIGGVTGGKKQTEAPQTETEPATEAVAQTEAQEPESAAETELASEAQSETEIETEIESESESEGLTAAEIFEEETEAEAGVYTYEDEKVTVTAKVSDPEAFPEGTVLVAEEVEMTQDEIAEMEAGLEEGRVLMSAVKYDIHFEDSEGLEIEPPEGVTVDVQIVQNDVMEQAEEASDMNVQMSHIKDDGEVESLPVDNATILENGAAKEVNFVTDSFSFFIKTVDAPVPLLSVSINGNTRNESGSFYMLLNGSGTSVDNQTITKNIVKKVNVVNGLIMQPEISTMYDQDGKATEPMKPGDTYKVTFFTSPAVEVPENAKTQEIRVLNAGEGKDAQIIKNGRYIFQDCKVINVPEEINVSEDHTQNVLAIQVAAQGSDTNSSYDRIESLLGVANDFGAFTMTYTQQGADTESTIAAKDATITANFNFSSNNFKSVNNIIKITKTYRENGELVNGKDVTITLYRNGVPVETQTLTTGAPYANKLKPTYVPDPKNPANPPTIEYPQADGETGKAVFFFDHLLSGNYSFYEKIGDEEVREHGPIEVGGVTVTYTDNESLKINTSGFNNYSYFDSSINTEVFEQDKARGGSYIVLGKDAWDKVQTYVGQHPEKIEKSGDDYFITKNHVIVVKADSKDSNGFGTIDFDAMFTSLTSASTTISQMCSSESANVYYISAEQLKFVEDAIPGVRGMNFSSNDGKKYIIVNVDMSGYTGEFTFDGGFKIDNEKVVADFVDTKAASILWNFYDYDQKCPYSGTLNLNGGEAMTGTFLAPNCNVTGASGNVGGTIIAKTYTHDKGEVHGIQPKVTQDSDEGSVSNSIGDQPEQPKGSLKVTKKAVVNDVVLEAAASDDFYVALFEDADGTRIVRSAELIKSGETVTFSDLEEGTYYVIETDSEGNPVKNAEAFQYEVSYDNADGVVRITPGAESSVTVTNSKDTETGVLLSVKKTFNGSTEKKFKVNLKAVTDGAPMPETTFVDVAGNGSTVFFDEITYTKENAGKSYTYKISEEYAGTTQDGVVYDGTVYEVRVTVNRDDNTGELSTNVEYRKLNKDETVAQDWTAWTGAAPFEFVNEKAKGSLHITKNVTVNGKTLPTDTEVSTVVDGEYVFDIYKKDGFNEENPQNPVGHVTITVAKGQASTGSLSGLDEGDYIVVERVGANGTSLVGENAIEVKVTAGEDAQVAANTASFTNNKNVEVKAKFDVSKAFTNGNEDTKFTVKLTAKAKAPMPEGSATVTVSQKESASFGNITYNEAGDYYYEISEQKDDPAADGVVYDGTVYEVWVDVDQNPDGTLSAVVKYRKQGLNEDPDEGWQEVTDDSFAFNFTNEQLGKLSVTKMVVDSGDKEPEDAEYTVTVTPKADQGRTIDMSGVTVTKNGVVVTDATVTDGSVTFTFKADERVTLNNMPEGTYVVKETTSDDFITEYSVSGSSADEGATLEVKGNEESVTVTNTYPTDVEMGLKATKDLTGGTLKENAYSFNLKLTGTAPENLSVKQEGGSAIPETGITLKNAANGDIVFDGFTFDKAGTYTFELTEVIPEDDTKDSGITYDTAKYIVTVVVELDDTAKKYAIESVSAEKYVKSGTEDTWTKSDEEVTVTAPAAGSDVYALGPDKTFVNTVKKGNLSVTKQVEGDTMDESMTYTVHVTNSKLTAEQWIEIFNDAENSGLKISAGLALLYGTAADGSSETVIGLTFSIGKDDTVQIKNLPIGTYKAEEIIDSGAAYEATYSVGADGSVLVEENETAADTITNTYPNKVRVSFGGEKAVEVEGEGTDNETVYPSETFTFSLYKAQETKNEDGSVSYEKVGSAIEIQNVTMPAPEGEDASFTFGGAEAAEAVQNALTFTKADTYYFIVEETVEESAKKNGFTYDDKQYVIKVAVTEQENSNDLLAKVSIIDEDGTEKTFTGIEADNLFDGLSFTNKYTYGDLEVEKKVVAATGIVDGNETYTIYVTGPAGTDLSGAVVKINDVIVPTAVKSETEKNVIVLTLTGEQKAKITQLPLGDYTVAEDIPDAEKDDYSASYAGGITVTDSNGVTATLVTLAQGERSSGSVTVTNSYTNKGELSVIKEVCGSWIPNPSEKYTIEITPAEGQDMTYAKVYRVTTDDEGKPVDTDISDALSGSTITVELMDGEMIVVRNLAPGAYRVVETTKGEFDTTYVVNSGNPVDSATITINNDTSGTVKVQNTYPNKGVLEVEKAVSGSTAPTEEAETNTWYEITVNGPKEAFTAAKVTPDNAAKYQEGTTAEDGSTVSFMLRMDGKVTFANLPVGEYTVTESTTGTTKSFTVAYGDNGTSNRVTLEGTQTSGKVTVNNHYPDATSMKLIGTKAVVGKDLENQTYHFSIEARNTYDGVTLEKAGEDIVNNNTGIDFGSITFTKAETYEFLVRETESGDKDVDVDGTVYTVVVEVANVSGDYQITKVEITSEKADGTSGASKTYENKEDGIWPDDGKTFALPEQTDGDEKASFINKVKTGSLSVKKTIVWGDVKNDKDSEASYTIHVTADPAVKWDRVTVSDGVTLTDIEGGKSFTIKDGQTVTLNNLPVGTYTVTEASGEPENYVATYVVTENGETLKSNTDIVLGKNDNVTVDITNTYPKNVPMGLKGAKKVEDGALKKYSFKLTTDAAEGVAFTAPAEDGSLIANNNIVDGTFRFDGITFSKEGTYTFTLFETEKTDEGIAYDEAIYNVIVTVAKVDKDYAITAAEITKIGEDGEETEVKSYGVGDGKAAVPADNVFELPEDTFTNREKRGNLEVTKIVTGDEDTIKAHTDDKYTVKVTNEDVKWDEWITVKKEDGTAASDLEDVSVKTEAGTQKVIGKQFTIAQDETVTFSGLPIGTYKVEEILPTGEKVLYKAEVSDKGTVTVEDGETAEVTVTNTYPTKASVAFSGTKTLDIMGIELGKDTETPQATFTFNLYETGDTYDVSGLEPKEPPIVVNDLKTAASRTFKFKPIDYTSEGTHYYVIKESVTVGSDETGFTNDEKVYKIKVVVAKDTETNALTVTKTDEKGNEINLDGFNFTNKYTYGALSVTKAVTGRAPEKTKYTVTVSSAKNFAGAKLRIGSEVKILTKEDVVPAEGTYSCTFELGANETASFTKLPVGSYNVTETTPEGANFEATYEVAGGDETGTGTGSDGAAVKLTPATNSGSVTITNTYTNKGALSITKRTSGSWVPDGKEYTITVTGGPAGADLSSNEIMVNGVNADKVTKSKNEIVILMPKETTVTISGLMPGSYKVTESDPDDGSSATYSVMVNGTVATDAKGEVTGRTGIATVEINNDNSTAVEVLNTYPEIGELKITKTVTGGTKDLYEDDKYAIEVSGSDGEDMSGASVSGAIAGTDSVSSGKITFQMTAGTTVTITGLKKGSYTITETSTGNYVETYTYKVGGSDVEVPVTGIPLGDVSSQSATVTNTYPDELHLTIDGDKKLVGRDLTEGEEFTFTLTEAATDDPKAILTGAENGVLKTKNNTDGLFSFSGITFRKVGTYIFEIKEIIEGEEDPDVIYDKTVYTAAVEVVKEGTQYKVNSVTVTAVNQDEEAVAVDGTEFEKAGTEGNSWTVTLPKHTDEETATFVNKIKKGSLKVQKIGVDAYEDDVFTFHVTLDGEPYTGTAKLEGPGASVDSVSITNGELQLQAGFSATIEGILYGTEYEVTEDKDDAYATVTPTNYKGTIGAEEPNITVTYTNTYRTNDVPFQPKVTKTVSGRPAPKEGETYTFNLKVTRRKGADGKTEELSNWAEPVTVDMSSAGTAIGEFTKREFTKADRGYTYIYTITEVIPDDAETVDGKKVKNGVTYDEAVYVYEVTIEDDSEGHLSANVVTKKNGAVIGTTQTIADNGEATAAFTNTYEEKGSVQFKGTKALTGGKTLESDMFEFRIEGTDGTNTTVKNQGNEITFPVIEYTEPGTYTYTITELNGGKTIDGITYDSDTYKVTVTVARSGNGKFNITVSGATKVGETDVYTLDVHLIEAAEGNTRAAKAATFVNEYSATGKASIETTKELVGRDLSKGEFTFVLKESDEAWTTDGKILKRASNGAGVPDEESGASKGTVSFTDFKTYTLADLGGATKKTFYYVILEDTEGKTDVEDGGITYDRDAVHVKVDVSDNGNGTLTAVAAIVDTKQGFINTYTANGSFKLNGNKELTGKRGEDVKADEFNFVITDEAGETVATGTTLAGGAINFETISYTLEDVGTHVYTVSEVIPKEDDENFDPTITYSTQSFEVKVLVLDRGNGTLVVSPSYMKGSMEFVNDYNATGRVPAGGLKKVNGKAVTPKQIERLNKLVEFQLLQVDGTTVTTLESKSLEPDGTFKFTDLAYTQADIGNTYTYQIKEFQIANNDELGGYTVDNTVYEFRVKVEDGEKHDGNLKLTLVDAEGNAIEGEPKLEAEFDNELTVEFHVNKTEVGDNSKEVEGAQLEVLDKDGNVLDSWTSKEGETHDFGSVLEEGKSYTLREKVAPDGYAYTTDIEFSVTDNGEIETSMPKTTDEAGNDTYLVEDAPLHFNVNKTDLTNDEEVEGAQLEVLDKDGKVVDSWTSKVGETHDFGAKLKAGESYTLREEVAPDGYAYVTDIEFKVEKDGTITTGMRKTTDEAGNDTYLVEDAPLHFNVNKTDLTNDEEVEGAQLEVLDKDGKVVDSWTSKVGETHDFGSKLKAGESYTLREEVAPDGYAYVTDIEFTVEKDGTITTDMRKTTDEDGNETYLVEDAPVIGSVKLQKLGPDGEKLAGAAFQLFYKTDETESGWAAYNNASYVTDMDGTLTVSGLQPNDYYFVETEAPAGFVIETDENGEPVKYPFTVALDEENKTQAEVLVELEVTNQPDEKDTTLVVTKQLVFNNELWSTVDATFYVALFEDEALTKRVSEIQPIVFEHNATSSTEFTGLELGKTYYVGETNEDGLAINSFGGMLATGEMYTVDFYDDNVVTMTRGDGTKVISFRNVFTEIPDYFYRDGKLTVTKQLLKADGTAKKSSKTFYAGIFDDAAFTKLSAKVSQNIVTLAMNGTSSVSDTVNVTVGEDGPTTVYVTEVDSSGNPVAGAASFQYDVTVDGSTVTMDLDHLSASAVITNQEREKESEEESEVFSEGESEGTVPESTKAVKTGDDSPIALYVGLLAAAALLLILAFVLKRKKKG